MKFSIHRRIRKDTRKADADEVIRAFVRVLAALAPRPHGGRPTAAAPVREKP